MAHRSLEEVVRTIAPRQRGTSGRPPIAVGISSSGTSSNTGDLATSLSQAGQQIAQLQSAYQQQASLITQNTQALQSNTSAKSGSAGSVLGGVASNLFGGAFGFLSPIISGIASLFAGNPALQPLPKYTPPSPISISGALQAAPAQPQASSGAVSQQPQAPGATAPPAASTGGGNQTSYSPQITVNVSAMDSQSFLDRSNGAVREAMLNMHPINNVVADL